MLRSSGKGMRNPIPTSRSAARKNPRLWDLPGGHVVEVKRAVKKLLVEKDLEICLAVKDIET